VRQTSAPTVRRSRENQGMNIKFSESFPTLPGA